MKKVLMIVAALAAIMALSLVTVAFENHVRWNKNLDECVYFFQQEDGRSVSCYVPEKECEGHTPKDIYKDVDASSCYYIPRKEQARLAASSECKEFVEGDLIVLQYHGEDPDNDNLTYEFGAPFDKSQQWQTKRGDAGEYHVKVKVSDGKSTDETEVCFRILPGNHPPKLSVKSVTAKEGEVVKLNPVCTDEDGDAVKISFAGAMTKGTWQTGYDNAGDYNVTVTCTDTEGASDSKTVTVTVLDVDRKPVLSGVRDITVSEGETVRLHPTCVDPDGTETTIVYGGDMTSSTWQTGYDDAGVYTVQVACEDATGMRTSKNIKVTVKDKNRPPRITAMVVKG